MNELAAGAFFTLVIAAFAVASVRKYPREMWVYGTELSWVTALLGAAAALHWWIVPIGAPLWLHTLSLVAYAAAGISCALIMGNRCERRLRRPGSSKP